MEREIVNRVANSTLVTFDLESYYVAGERVFFDLKPFLFQEMVLKEKDFRKLMSQHLWNQYAGKHVAIGCSVDAIIPTWAFMLLTLELQPYAKTIVQGSLLNLEEWLFNKALSSIDWAIYKDAKVVIKGCSKVIVPVSAYVEVSNRLRPFAASLMFGEACSTVPLYKRQKH